MLKILIPILIILSFSYSQQAENPDNVEFIDLYVSFYFGIIPDELVRVYLIDPYGDEMLVTSERMINRLSHTDYSDFKYKIEKNAMTYIRIEFPERKVSIIHGLVYSKTVYMKVSIALDNEIRLLTSDTPIVRE